VQLQNNGSSSQDTEFLINTQGTSETCRKMTHFLPHLQWNVPADNMRRTLLPRGTQCGPEAFLYSLVFSACQSGRHYILKACNHITSSPFNNWTMWLCSCKSLCSYSARFRLSVLLKPFKALTYSVIPDILCSKIPNKSKSSSYKPKHISSMFKQVLVVSH
jgi:hypothetical protein